MITRLGQARMDERTVLQTRLAPKMLETADRRLLGSNSLEQVR